MKLLGMLYRSITMKTLALISVLVVVVFAMLIVVNSYWQRIDTMNQIQEMGYRTTDLIELNIEEPMLIGDNQGTYEQFARVDRLYDDLTVYLTDFRGNITYSTRSGVLRQDMEEVYRNQEVLESVRDSLQSQMEKSALVELDDSSFFMTVRSVPNDSDCYHCHGRSQSILGSMLVMQNVDPTLALLQKHQLQNVLLSLGCLLLLFFALMYFLKKTIINRITYLHDKGMKISGGSLEEQFKDLGSDEVGKLGQSFELMVNNLKQKIKEAQDKSVLAEEQTRKAQQAMEELVEAQQKLVQSERFAAIGEAASHLSHEIKNPLMLMAGFAKQVRQKFQESSSEQEKLDIIIQEAQRLEKMLNQVRDFTRPRTLQKELVDINELIAETVKIFNKELEDSKIKYQSELSPDLPQVNIDRDQVKQVLLNLIKNSLEAMSGAGTLIVGSRAEGRFVRVWVEDTGPGIPPVKMKYIFSPIFTTKDKGTGLGLAVSYRIIQDHGGDLSADSKTGQGAKFTLYLPMLSNMEKEGKAS